MPALDTVIVGAGLRGLAAALAARHQQPEIRLAVVDSHPWPGADVRTQRSNGFVCELGPFAFARDELEPLLALLRHAPTPIECRDSARTGCTYDGTTRHEVAVDPAPVSFGSGCEEIVQACRRELGETLRLGRPVTAILPADADDDEAGRRADDSSPGDELIVELGGEVPTRMSTTNVVLAIEPVAAGRILNAFDPGFAQLTPEAGLDARAFVFFGALAKDTPEVRGYGMLAAEPLASPIAEIIHCTEAFAGRALADRSLLRVETDVLALPDDDEQLASMIEAELRRWNGTSATFGFRKVHRFASTTADGIQAECRSRVEEIASRVPGLSLAP